MNDKIIVSNRSALTGKYGTTGLTKINKALKNVIAADAKRGLKTVVIFLDDPAEMKKTGGTPVTNSASPSQNKKAVDAVFSSFEPDYLVILGSPEIVPHQDLSNPVFEPGRDDDATAWSDLPYACDASYSKDPAHFVGPTRVVGRLPDLVGASDPAYLIDLINRAAGYKTRPAADYASYFGLSAEVWKGSTTLSLENIFGQADSLLTSPAAGPKYSNSELKPFIHFINCHGAVAGPEFYGQQGQEYPVCLTTNGIAGQIGEGTVTAAECCYGAELYDCITLGIDVPISQSYLSQGAYGFFGSTTIAYGPPDGNGAADFICQDFLLGVLEGASLGRAALRARHRFVERTGQMDPVDLKTLAQFYLLGDPSIHPVAVSTVTEIPQKTMAEDANRFSRAERRQKLRMMGEFLQMTKPTASKKVDPGAIAKGTGTTLRNIAKKAGLTSSDAFITYAVKSAKRTTSAGKAHASAVPLRYFVALKATKKGPNRVNRGVAVVAKELDGRIVGFRIYHQR